MACDGFGCLMFSPTHSSHAGMSPADEEMFAFGIQSVSVGKIIDRFVPVGGGGWRK